MKSFLDNYYGDSKNFKNTKPAVKILEKAVNEIVDFKFYHFSSDDIVMSDPVTKKLLEQFKRHLPYYHKGMEMIFGLIERYNIPFMYSSGYDTTSTPETASITLYYNDIIISADLWIGLFFNTYSNIVITDANTMTRSSFSTNGEISTFQPFSKTVKRIICSDNIEKINSLVIKVDL